MLIFLVVISKTLVEYYKEEKKRKCKFKREYELEEDPKMKNISKVTVTHTGQLENIGFGDLLLKGSK